MMSNAPLMRPSGICGIGFAIAFMCCPAPPTVVYMPEPADGTHVTELRASALLSEQFPHNMGYTYGVVCYAPPDWCRATVIALSDEPVFMTLNCSNKCIISEVGE